MGVSRELTEDVTGRGGMAERGIDGSARAGKRQGQPGDTSAVVVATVMSRARAVQAEVASWDQRRVDEVVAAVGRVCWEGDAPDRLAALAAAETGLGHAGDLPELHRTHV